MVNLVALQMTSAPSVEENLDTVANEMASAKIEKNSLVVLPECFAYFGGKDKGQLAVAETKGEGEIQRRSRHAVHGGRAPEAWRSAAA